MPHSMILGSLSATSRLGVRQHRRMCAALRQQNRPQPLACYVASCTPRIRARARTGFTSAYNGNRSSVSGVGSDSPNQRDSSTANNSAEQPGWTSGDYNGPGSAWSDNNWPSGADWGDTVNPGDWGEVPSFGQPASYSTGYTQQEQQYSADSAVDPAAGNSSSESSSYNYGASGQFNQSNFTGTAAGTFYGTDYTTSGSRNGFNGKSSYHSNSGSQQPDSASSWPFADASAAQQQQQRQQNSFRGPNNLPPLLPSDITLIGRRDADSMLPLAPSIEQARYYQPRTLSERLVQIMGSFGVSVVLSKSAVLAGPALLYPVWGPWIRAGIRNVQMYLRQFKSVGLWRAEVISVQLNTVPYAYRQAVPVGDSVTITVGDPWQGGARTELTFPYQAGCEDIVEGEPAELLVLCQDDAFMNFKVVRELYLPQSGMWLWEYPFVDRDVFLDVSLAIERGRQAATGSATSPPAAAAAGSYQTYEGYQQPYAGYAPAAGATAGAGAAGGLYGSMGSDAGIAGSAGAAGWVGPDGRSSSSGGGTAGSISSSNNGYQGYSSGTAFSGSASNDSGLSGAVSSGSGAMYDNGSAAEPPLTNGSTYNYGNTSSSKYSKTAAADSRDAAAAAAVAAGGLIDEFAGVASQVGAVASQVTGVATHAASDVASGVAAGVAAGLGWINSAAPASSSSDTSNSSNSDNAVVPDVIIDSQGVWSPMGGVMSSSNYMYDSSSSSSYGHGLGGSYSSSNSWPGQQMGSYGQPYVDPGSFGVYQRDAAGFGPGHYASGVYGTPGRAPGGYVGYQTGNGFNATATSGWSSPGPNYSNRYEDSSGSSGYAGSNAGESAAQQSNGTAQDPAGWQEQAAGPASGPGTGNTAEAARTQ